uniref:Uncharacterized protein n=1 Tax=Anguilla anguilla TaxID=7936 RepID=A0A0E9WZW0_ANGAN
MGNLSFNFIIYVFYFNFQTTLTTNAICTVSLIFCPALKAYRITSTRGQHTPCGQRFDHFLKRPFLSICGQRISNTSVQNKFKKCNYCHQSI